MSDEQAFGASAGSRAVTSVQKERYPTGDLRDSDRAGSAGWGVCGTARSACVGAVWGLGAKVRTRQGEPKSPRYRGHLKTRAWVTVQEEYFEQLRSQPAFLPFCPAQWKLKVRAPPCRPFPPAVTTEMKINPYFSHPPSHPQNIESH